jgi:hypothetical protein
MKFLFERNLAVEHPVHFLLLLLSVSPPLLWCFGPFSGLGLPAARVRMSAPCSTPNLEAHGLALSLCLAPRSKPVQHGWPYQQLGCHWHSFQVHWCTQATSYGYNMPSTRIQTKNHQNTSHMCYCLSQLARCRISLVQIITRRLK